MGKCLKVVARVPVCLEEGKKYQVELVGNEVVISKEFEPEWSDITKSCYLVFRHSQHCDGRYIAVMDSRTCKAAVVIGMHGIVAQKGYRIEKAPLAFTSFKVFRKN